MSPLLSGVDFVAALRLGSVYFDFYYSVFSSLRLELLPYARPFVVSDFCDRVMPSDVLFIRGFAMSLRPPMGCLLSCGRLRRWSPTLIGLLFFFSFFFTEA